MRPKPSRDGMFFGQFLSRKRTLFETAAFEKNSSAGQNTSSK
jgi:hypothetical protein